MRSLTREAKSGSRRSWELVGERGREGGKEGEYHLDFQVFVITTLMGCTKWWCLVRLSGTSRTAREQPSLPSLSYEPRSSIRETPTSFETARALKAPFSFMPYNFRNSPLIYGLGTSQKERRNITSILHTIQYSMLWWTTLPSGLDRNPPDEHLGQKNDNHVLEIAYIL